MSRFGHLVSCALFASICTVSFGNINPIGARGYFQDSLHQKVNPADHTWKLMPKFKQFERLIHASRSLVDLGVQSIRWNGDGTEFSFYLHGKLKKCDARTHQVRDANTAFPVLNMTKSRPFPSRAEQHINEYSLNGKLRAQYRDGNVVLIHRKTDKEVQVTTEGGKNRIKYGSACWAYGEELNVKNAMWFSPDSKFLAFYRMDESKVPDYYLAFNQLQNQDTLDKTAYPIVGAHNPKASLLIYNIKTKKTVEVDSSKGDPSLAEYLFEVHWSPNGHQLLFYRENRSENHLQLCTADPETGNIHVVLDEHRTDGWIDTNRYSNLHPHFFKNGKDFLWISDRTGYRNIYLGNLDGRPLKQLTHLHADVEKIVLIDENDGYIFYTARNGERPTLLQLNRVKVNGTSNKRLTDPSLSHECFVAPIKGDFVDIAQSLTSPPVANLCNSSGKVVAELSKADLSKMESLNVRPQQPFTALAADGKTILYGRLGFPSDFDPHKQYPMIVDMYGGPESGGQTETFSPSSAICEFGFITMTVDCRGSAGRGRAFMCSVYHQLGKLEIDDCATVVKELCNKYPYINAKRVGIEGTSYGGYFAALSILRHPNTYRASCASSPVTDFRLYDSIYTERYMGLPGSSENESGYKAGSCMTYAKNLKGYLLLYFGTADNNVHPANTLRLTQSLDKAQKRYSILVGPDQGHSMMPFAKMMEYFIQHLIISFYDTDAKNRKAI